MLEERSAPVVVEVAPRRPQRRRRRPVASEAVAVVARRAPAAAAPAPARPKMTPKPVVVVQPAVLERSPVQVSNPADGVVVRRNVVINVGAGQPPRQGDDQPGCRAGAVTADAAARAARTMPCARAVASSPETARARPARSPSRSRSPRRATSACPGRRPRHSAISQPVGAAAQSAAEAPAAARRRQDPDALGSPRRRPARRLSRASSSSDKSLDEVILEYLADDGDARRIVRIVRAERQSIRATSPRRRRR